MPRPPGTLRQWGRLDDRRSVARRGLTVMQGGLIGGTQGPDPASAQHLRRAQGAWSITVAASTAGKPPERSLFGAAHGKVASAGPRRGPGWRGSPAVASAASLR